MKKFTTILMLLAGVGLIIACGKKATSEEEVRNYGKYFIEKLNAGQLDSLKATYPEIDKADSIVTVKSDTIIVVETAPGQFDMILAEGVALKVSHSTDGKITVLESKGLFAFPENQIELARKESTWNDELSDIQKREIIKETLEKRKSFTSPDLDFFNLHGPVKSVSISYTGLENGESLFDGWGAPGNYYFNEEGIWINPNVYKLERNNKGQICKFYFSKEGLDDWHFCEDFKWKGNKLVFFSIYGVEGRLSYDDNIVSKIALDHFYTMYSMEDKIKFSNWKFDEQGNWISCKWNQIISYETGDDDPIPPEKNSGLIIRKIVYF